MDLCERIIDGDQLPLGLKPAVRKNLGSFVGVVRKLRRAAQKVGLVVVMSQLRLAHSLQGTSVGDLLHMVIEKTEYEDHLKRTQQDFDSRWENVQELVCFHM